MHDKVLLNLYHITVWSSKIEFVYLQFSISLSLCLCISQLFGSTQIGPWQIGPLWFFATNWVLANWVPANRAPANRAPANRAPANWAPGKCWSGKLGPGNQAPVNWVPAKLAPQIHIYSYTIELIHKYSMILDRVWSIQTYTLKNILKLNSFCCYLIHSADNFGIHKCQLEDVGFAQRAFVSLSKFAYSRICIFLFKHNLKNIFSIISIS